MFKTPDPSMHAQMHALFEPGNIRSQQPRIANDLTFHKTHLEITFEKNPPAKGTISKVKTKLQLQY